MVAYELMVILNPELSEEETESTLQRLQDIVREGKGEVSNLDKWGKRRLAYEVKKFREGYYAVMNFKAAPAVAAEVERIIKITDNIIRYLLIRDEKAEREEREKREPEKVQEEE
ncbi:MAG TPA: 30S ribosomal protein S6 [Firmicutes bacterium]|nr:30S ribosomal protein S6 [Bacillota bacterium]